MRGAFFIAREVRDWVNQNDQESLAHFRACGNYPEVHTKGKTFRYSNDTEILVYSGEPPKSPLITAIGPTRKSVFLSSRWPGWPNRLRWFLIKESLRNPRTLFKKPKRVYRTMFFKDWEDRRPDVQFVEGDHTTVVKTSKGFTLDVFRKGE